MKHIVTLLLATATLLVSTSGHCDQLRFTGNTRADITLIKDALRNVQLFAQAKFNCQSIEAVEAEVLPLGYTPPGGPHPEGEAKSQYESWLVTMCGRKKKFLLATWQSPPTPGVMFRVGYPFPSEPYKQ
jgi:hypothetical protein